MKNFSPELILLWARRTILLLEIEFLQSTIKEYDDGKRDENLTEEQNTAKYEHTRKTLAEA